MSRRPDNAVHKALAVQRTKWIDALNESSIDELRPLLTEDVAWYPPSGEPMRSKKEVLGWLKSVFGEFSYTMKVHSTSLRWCDAGIVDTADFQLSLTLLSHHATSVHAGRFELLWRENDSGLWQIARYTGSVEHGEHDAQVASVTDAMDEHTLH